MGEKSKSVSVVRLEHRSGYFKDSSNRWRKERRTNPDRRADIPIDERVRGLRSGELRRETDQEMVEYLESKMGATNLDDVTYVGGAAEEPLEHKKHGPLQDIL